MIGSAPAITELPRYHRKQIAASGEEFAPAADRSQRRSAS
jgi:hypothetical protein